MSQKQAYPSAEMLKYSPDAIRQTDKNCVHQCAVLGTDVINELRYVIYADGKTEQIINNYLDVFKSNPSLSLSQLTEIENLFKLLPNDRNLDDLPYLFERLDEFDRSVSAQLPDKEAPTVLLGSAVMRASLEYWLIQLDGSSNWFDLSADLPSTDAARRGWWKKVLKFVAADAGGCLGGSLIAGIPGCVIGAIGASAGAGAAG